MERFGQILISFIYILTSQGFSVYSAPNNSLGLGGAEWTKPPWPAKMFIHCVYFDTGLNLKFLKCKQKHDLSLDYVTKICELCILLLTWRSTLKFSFRMKKMHYWSIVFIKNGEGFDQNHDYAPLNAKPCIFIVDH